MQVLKYAQHQSQQGSPDWFSGTVHIDSLFAQQEPAYVSGGRVTFQPQVRTAWHTLHWVRFYWSPQVWVMCRNGVSHAR